ncbi:MAG: 23S rRNA (adenine(2030)-N(6))-methyltransferase RlmJ [Hyphomicrobiaceae bacterium]|nr:23S rRNA (adenine(2030)-N(6))-methyltransferase RlmJ [Hyphomicrobiaceae bacterium]
MNYDHLFHAGNFADVVKHIILVRIITYLQRKPAAFRVIDTHAGAGIYDLASERARKNPEWEMGIARLLANPPGGEAGRLVAPYLDLIEAMNDGELSEYPGSPLIARRLLRPHDRLSVMELHPDAAAALKGLLGGDAHVKVMELDGYAALPAQLPPKEKRGLVLVDPPFEEAGEFDRLVGLLVKAHRHFPTGAYALWYPLKDEAATVAFKRHFFQTGISAILSSELWLRAPSVPPRLFGTGMIVVNPPFVLKDELDHIFAALVPIFSDARSAGFRNEWIRPAP